MTHQAKMRLFYTSPAPTVNDECRSRINDHPLAGWEKWSLPVGNSYFGVSLFGRIARDRMQITENSICNPQLYAKDWRWGAGGTRTFGDIYVESDIDESKVTDFSRDLVLDDGTGHTVFTYDGVTYEREYFVSYPDRALVAHFTASKKGALTFTVKAEIPFTRDYCNWEGDGAGRSAEIYHEGDTLVMRGLSDYYHILQEGRIKVQTVGGTVNVTDDGISVTAADEVTLLFTCGTNYKLESRVFTEPDVKKKLSPYDDPHAAVTARLEKIAESSFADLRERHVADHKALFDRVKVNIGFDEKDLAVPTNELVDYYKNGKRSAYLETLYYQFGRYLLIASSRPGGYPANLQGTWCAYDSSPWACDYHHNINIQMNYWPSGIGNLAECFIPYMDYAKAYMEEAHRSADEYIEKFYPDKLAPAGENGWSIGTSASPYFIDRVTAGSHSGPGTGGFTSLLFWDYYTYTGDKDYLREVGYPFLRDMSVFLSKVLIEKDGFLLVRDSASPEQVINGKYYATTGCAFDQQMIYENHKRTLQAAEILGITDDPILDVIRSQIDRLDPVQIGLDGQVKEFREEGHYGEIGEYEHRHISHLVGLYPATIINKNTPEWLEGAKIALTKRSDKSTGWAAAHRLCAWTRTGMGNRAYDLLTSILKNNTLPNLWDTHPPFQIDGNFGSTAGMSEMFLQSQAGFLDFLAARPDVWQDVSFDGIVAQGNFVCGCDYHDGQMEEMRVEARTGGTCRIRYKGIGKAKTDVPVKVVNDDEITLDMAKHEKLTVTF